MPTQIVALAKGCQQLQWLNFEGCRFITDEGQLGFVLGMSVGPGSHVALFPLANSDGGAITVCRSHSPRRLWLQASDRPGLCRNKCVVL